MGYHFGVGASPILVFFSGNWDGGVLDFDPWPSLLGLFFFQVSISSTDSLFGEQFEQPSLMSHVVSKEKDGSEENRKGIGAPRRPLMGYQVYCEFSMESPEEDFLSCHSVEPVKQSNEGEPKVV